MKSKIESLRGIKKEMLDPESFLAVIRIDDIKSLMKRMEDPTKNLKLLQKPDVIMNQLVMARPQIKKMTPFLLTFL